MIHILEKGEKADPMWGMDTEIITDEMIEALQQGKRLYLSVNDEYAVVIKKDGKRKTDNPEATDTDTISRQAEIEAVDEGLTRVFVEHRDIAEKMINKIPSAQPYTDEEIQAMQDLEQAQLDKAYELGLKEGREALRQEAIDAIEILLEQSEDDEHDKTWNNAIRGAINSIKHHVPSASQRTGHWIHAQYPYSKCSICEEEFDTLSYEANYCPNCGAKMMEDEND